MAYVLIVSGSSGQLPMNTQASAYAALVKMTQDLELDVGKSLDAREGNKRTTTRKGSESNAL
jgi:hypothetical protein